MASNDEFDEILNGGGSDAGDKIPDNDFELVDKPDKLKSMREKFSWEINEERGEFLRQLYSLISNWESQLPNLRDIFRREEIDWLLTEDAENSGKYLGHRRSPLIEFVIHTGYKDEPDFDEDGKPLLRRSTPVHWAAKHAGFYNIIHNLFKIYDRFDVNYTDESGLTHFHIACQFDCHDAVEKFLEFGYDPNLLLPETHESPLHLALTTVSNNPKTVELLLRNGADPSLLNVHGLAPLHLIISRVKDDFITTVFKLINDKHHPVDVKTGMNGTTALQMALYLGKKKHIELLLRSGADPNLTDDLQNRTPLHFICNKYNCEDFVELFFKINDELQQTVQVDARDELGRTPLQYAVMRLAPGLVEFLLDRGADLANFIFPTKSHFAEYLCISELRIEDMEVNLERASNRALAVVERLEKGGYELDRSDALTIMKLFAQYLGKIESREFLLPWALELFLELTYYKLPILCCEKIIKMLINEDLLRICLAVDIVTNQQSQSM